MQSTTVYDFIGTNVGKITIPAGVLAAGYTTGSGDVPWSAAAWARYPNAVRIDQSPTNTSADELADVIDMEQEAATLADLVPWVNAAWVNFKAGHRPGQRTPAVYCSQSNVTPAVNQLIAGGITSGVNLWVAEQMTAKQAQMILDAAGGPFPIIGVQYEFDTDHDVSLFSTAWLNNTSRDAQATPPKASVQTGWRFCSKCQGLFWGPGQSRSVCPRGAEHDGSQSHVYTLEIAK